MTYFTFETRKKILEALRNGATERLAAGYGNITLQRLRSWLRRGEIEVKRIEENEEALPNIDEQDYAQFFLDYNRASADIGVKLISAVVNNRSWRAKAWVLERRFPSEYGRDNALPNESEDAQDWWKAAEAALSSVDVEVKITL